MVIVSRWFMPQNLHLGIGGLSFLLVIILLPLVCFSIRDGQCRSTWFDPWLDGCPILQQSSAIVILDVRSYLQTKVMISFGLMGLGIDIVKRVG